MKPEAVHRSAFKLLNNPKITARVAELKNELSERGIADKERALK